MTRAPYAGGISGFASFSIGNLAPNAYLLPTKPGGMAVTEFGTARLSVSATLTPAQPMEATDSSSLDAGAPQLDQIVSGVASASAALSITDALLASAAGLSANGAGALTVDNALCGAIFSVSASSAQSLSGAVTLTALANLGAQAGGPTPLSPEGLSQELLDNQDVEAGYSVRESMRLILSTLAGKVSGAPGTSISIRNVTDTKTRLIATVDANGNRSALTYDVSE